MRQVLNPAIKRVWAIDVCHFEDRSARSPLRVPLQWSDAPCHFTCTLCGFCETQRRAYTPVCRQCLIAKQLLSVSWNRLRKPVGPTTRLKKMKARQLATTATHWRGGFHIQAEENDKGVWPLPNNWKNDGTSASQRRRSIHLLLVAKISSLPPRSIQLKPDLLLHSCYLSRHAKCPSLMRKTLFEAHSPLWWLVFRIRALMLWRAWRHFRRSALGAIFFLLWAVAVAPISDRVPLHICSAWQETGVDWAIACSCMAPVAVWGETWLGASTSCQHRLVGVVAEFLPTLGLPARWLSPPVVLFQFLQLYLGLLHLPYPSLGSMVLS